MTHAGGRPKLFETGEYQKNEVLEVVKLPDDTVYKVTVECVDQPEQTSTN